LVKCHLEEVQKKGNKTFKTAYPLLQKEMKNEFFVAIIFCIKKSLVMLYKKTVFLTVIPTWE
jgi:hypothetical protein